MSLSILLAGSLMGASTAVLTYTFFDIGFVASAITYCAVGTTVILGRILAEFYQTPDVSRRSLA